MTHPNPTSLLEDSLSPITRAERRNLLISSTIGVLLAQAGLLPTQISALGITLSIPARNVLLLVMMLITLYFVLAFIFYGLCDFFIWRSKYQDYLAGVECFNENWSLEDQKAYDASNLPKIGWLYQHVPQLAYIRTLFEYALPILVGLYATSVLVIYRLTP